MNKTSKIIIAVLAFITAISFSTTTKAAEVSTDVSTEVSDEVLAEISEEVSSDISEADSSASQSSSAIHVASYMDWEFTTHSAREPLDLNVDCDTISVYAVCENGATDELILQIVDLTHGGIYDTDLRFTADGSVTTFARALPAGHYTIKFILGDSEIVKLEAAAVFTVLDN